ncbi:hypothetical protein VP01_78g3 [Puccinia sorghi]|uniref:Reverse transcriptase Ty1/copia-type domain-containing protein n=1 Tax=Puccinia sorghi TaxID=27349 RepID=A0A0L6UAU6_9BASI|nr:hypothetical protein VP01_78g3 [Puccinia sorghi]
MSTTLLSLDKRMSSKNCFFLDFPTPLRTLRILCLKGLEMLGLENCRPVKTPLTPAIQLHTATDADHQAFLKLNLNYRSYTGMLNYLSCRTRPDLAAAVSILSKFNQRPGLSHWKEVIHCWKYLKGTSDLGLLLKPKKDKILDRISWYTDATWAEDQESRISRSGSLAFWKSCPILWNSKKQKNITMSSTESELNALSDGEQENQWLTFLIEELWKIKLAPTLFHIDNKGLLEKLKNFGSNSKTKHLDIKAKNLREKFKNEEIAVDLIPSSQMIADSLSKAAPHSSIKKLQQKCLSILSSTTKEGYKDNRLGFKILVSFSTLLISTSNFKSSSIPQEQLEELLKSQISQVLFKSQAARFQAIFLLLKLKPGTKRFKMDNINATILKTTIEAIPILTEENFSSWRTRITALFKLGGLKDQMIDGQPDLEEDDNTILCAIILSKLSTQTQNNVVNSENEDNAQLLWKAILKRFISSEPSNRARVYNQFSNIEFDISNIEKFITEVRSIIVKMQDQLGQH